MTIVTLTTDFGHKDYSVSVIKAALLQQIPNLSVIDISHQISPYNPSETAYVLKNAFRAFPEGTIHIIGVESEWTPENIHLAIEFEGHFFIGADNGILSMIIDDLKNLDLIDKLINNGVNFKEEVRKTVKFVSEISDKIFVLTGTLPTLKREVVKQIIEQYGGKVTSTVSKKTDYLLAGNDAGSKLEKAQALGIVILSENDLIKWTDE